MRQKTRQMAYVLLFFLGSAQESDDLPENAAFSGSSAIARLAAKALGK
jgi:hypothetical protein